MFFLITICYNSFTKEAMQWINKKGLNILKQFISKYKHGWVLFYFFIYMAWFLYLEGRTDVNFTPIHIKLDDLVPFNELFVIPYFLWFAYIAGAVLLFFFKSKEDFYKCTAFLFIGMTICLIIYTIWPNGQNLRPSVFPRDNFLTDMVKGLYQTDTSTNVCPSIHVFNSIAVHIAISRSSLFDKHKIIKAGSFILMIAICLSTVFLKQHSVFDGICAVALSCVMYVLVYKVDYVKLFGRKKAESTAY